MYLWFWFKIIKHTTQHLHACPGLYILCGVSWEICLRLLNMSDITEKQYVSVFSWLHIKIILRKLQNQIIIHTSSFSYFPGPVFGCPLSGFKSFPNLFGAIWIGKRVLSWVVPNDTLDFLSTEKEIAQCNTL